MSGLRATTKSGRGCSPLSCSGADSGNADGLADAGHQFIQINRLGQVINRAVAHGGDGIADVGEGGDEQNGQGGVFLARQPQRLQPGESRHPHVGNHHAEFSGAEGFQGLLAGLRRDGFQSLGAEKDVQQAALARVVIHDEDARRVVIFFAQFSCHGARLDKPGDGQKKFPGSF